MCLAIRGDGHITVKLLYEQIWPEVVGNELRITLCLDLVLRNNTTSPLKSLHILSPHRLPFENGQIPVCDPDDGEKYNWIQEDYRKIPDHKNQWKVVFEGSADAGQLDFEATRLAPVLEEPDWRLYPDNTQAVLLGAGMTLASLQFEGDEVLAPFDQNNAAATTYWVRLVLRPIMKHHIADQISFRMSPTDGRRCFIQPFQLLGPVQVITKMENNLDVLQRERDIALYVDAPEVKKALRESLFMKPNTSIRIEEHRLSIVTDNRVLVMNPIIQGQCRFGGVHFLRKQERVARTLFTGARHHCDSDPLRLARKVYGYLSEWAMEKEDAKTKEQVSVALSPASHPNTSHVVEALHTLGFLKCLNDRQYYIQSPEISADKLFRKELNEASDELFLGKDDNTIRSALYGKLRVPGIQEKYSRFTPRSFAVHFDLAYTV